MWLVNELVQDFFGSIQSDNSIESYRVCDLQTDTFIKTVFPKMLNSVNFTNVE